MYHVIHLADDVPRSTPGTRRCSTPTCGGRSTVRTGPRSKTATPRCSRERPVRRVRWRRSSRPTSATRSRASSCGTGRGSTRLGCMVDDIDGFARFLLDHDVYIGLPGGTRMEEVPPDLYYFYPSPRSVGGLLRADHSQHRRRVQPECRQRPAPARRLGRARPALVRTPARHPPARVRHHGGAPTSTRPARSSRSSGWRCRCTTASTRDAACDRASCSSATSCVELASPLSDDGPARRARRTLRRHALPTHVPRRRPRLGGGVPPHRRRALRPHLRRRRHRRTPTTASAPTTRSAPKPVPATLWRA